MPKSFFHKLSLCLIAAFLSFGAGFAPADEATAPAVKQDHTEDAGNSITVDAVVAEVLEKNPELKFYEAEIDAAKGARRTAGLWANPEAGGSIGQKKVWNEDGDLTGKGRAGDVSVTQTFEWPGRMGLRRAIADRDVDLAKLGLEQFRATLEARARVAAYEFYSKQEIAASAREVADHFKSLREVLLERDPAGLTPLLETRVIEAMDLNTQRRASGALLAAKTAQFELNRLRGEAPDTPISLAQPRLAFKPLEDSRSLIDLARTNDFEVRMREAEVARSKSLKGLAENERLPAVSVGPSFSQERAGERERVMAVAVSMPLPIWNQNQGEIQEAKARLAQSETLLEIARRDAESHLLETVTLYEAKLKEMAQWRPDSIQHFKDAAELADRHYRLGSVPVSVYVDLQAQYLDAIEGLHDTRKEALDAATRLEILTGKRLSLAREEK